MLSTSSSHFSQSPTIWQQLLYWEESRSKGKACSLNKWWIVRVAWLRASSKVCTLCQSSTIPAEMQSPWCSCCFQGEFIAHSLRTRSKRQKRPPKNTSSHNALNLFAEQFTKSDVIAIANIQMLLNTWFMPRSIRSMEIFFRDHYKRVPEVLNFMREFVCTYLTKYSEWTLNTVWARASSDRNFNSRSQNGSLVAQLINSLILLTEPLSPAKRIEMMKNVM